MYYLILLVFTMVISCKPKDNSKEKESTKTENLTKTETETENSELRTPFRGSATVTWPTGVYLLTTDASEEELENIISVEFENKDEEQGLNLTKVFGFKFKNSPIKFGEAIRTVKNKKIPKIDIKSPLKSRKGDFFENPPRRLAPVEITKVVSSNGHTIPIRAVKTFDDIPVGSGEYAYVTLTKKQYDILTSRQGGVDDETARTVHSLVRETYDGSGVILRVDNNRIFATKTALDSENPKMFSLENRSHGKTWDAVKEDLGQGLDSIESSISKGTRLGGGTFGVAHLITRSDGTQYVLKKMSIKEEANLREIATLTEGSCKDCLQYYGAVKKGDNYYLASEYASGGELGNRVAREAITNDEIIQLLTQGKQLADKGLINKDIKLENVLFTPSGKVKLMDHGLAQRNPTWLTREGSPHTVSPEVYKELVIPHGYADRVHTYSLAMSILDGKSRALVEANFKAIKKNNRTGQESNIKYVKNPPFTSEEQALLKKMLEPDIKKRISISDALTQWKALPRNRN